MKKTIILFTLLFSFSFGARHYVNTTTNGTNIFVGMSAYHLSNITANIDMNNFCIKSSSNIGIGTNNPTHSLHIDGETGQGAHAIRIEPTQYPTSLRASIELAQWVLGQDALTNGTADFFLSKTNGITPLFIDAFGNTTFNVLGADLDFSIGGTGAVKVLFDAGLDTFTVKSDTHVTNGSDLFVNGTNVMTEIISPSGGRAYKSVRKTTNYTLTANDYICYADGTTNTVGITLPSASDRTGATFIVKAINIDFAVTVLGVLDGTTNFVFATENDAINIHSDGTDWRIF